MADPRAAIDPWLQCAVDWDATIAYRRHLWSLGLGVAEAMDTAQRGMGLDWPTSLELIRRSLDAARDMPGALIASGCGTDHLALENVRTVDEVIAGYEEQMAAIEKLGGKLIVMASRALARVAAEPGRLRARLRAASSARREQPVILHWLGDMFDPALAGYWGSHGRGRGDGHRAGHHRRARGQGRRHQDLAAGQGQGDRHAAAPAAGRAHVHRRRLQLRRS